MARSKLRSIAWVLGGIVIFTLVFLFLPTGATDSFAMPDTARSYAVDPGSLMQAYYADVGELNKEILPNITVGGTRSILEVCEPGNLEAKGTLVPISDYRFTSQFAIQRDLNGGYHHSGTDIAYGSSKAVWLLAPFSGTVVVEDYTTGYGRYVIVESNEFPGLCFLYAHMAPGNASSHGGKQPGWQSTISNSVQVHVGDNVSAGQRIGLMGTTGPSTGVHLHFELQLHTQGTNVVPYAQSPSGNCYRASAYEWLNGKELSDLTWLYTWYVKGNGWRIGDSLSSDDVAFLSLTVEDAAVGEVDENA